MKKKNIFLIVLFALLVIPLFSATLSEDMNEINSYVENYKSGEISAPQLIVYIEYTKNKMYERLDRERKKAFNEEEIKEVFLKRDKDKSRDWKGSDYEKEFKTENFNLVFNAFPFYRYDREYYENREEDTISYYLIGYSLEPIKGKNEKGIGSEIKEIIIKLNNLAENVNDEDYENLREDLSKVKFKMWNINNQEECVRLMKNLGMEEQEKDYPSKERNFYFKIKEVMKKDCWTNTQCNNICENKEVCETIKGDEECYQKEVCEDICEEEFDSVTNETIEVCDEICETKEVCEQGKEYDNCWTENNCYDECKNFEECNEFVNGELKLEANCREDSSDIYVSAWGEEFNYFQGLNEGDSWNCDNEIQGLLGLRKELQKDLDNDFAKWYFEDFMSGDDMSKIINGEYGFRGVLDMLIRNEERIAENLHCSESGEWPEGFLKIDITYINNNTHVEVWEKNIPVEWANTRYWTTLYKYSWVPDRESLKKLIDYKLSEMNTIGPSAKDIARIRADKGQMEIIKSLSENYGGSFVVKLELKDENNNIIEKYLEINEEVIIQVTDNIPEKQDILITIDYNALYDFISYMSYEINGERIEGPNWVRIENNEGPGKVFSVLGAISKMWKEGVTIKPRYTLLKLFFNSKDIITLMTAGEGDSSEYDGESIKISGEAIKR